MIFESLSVPETKLIAKCADLMIQSLTRIAHNSHPLFNEFYEVYAGCADNQLDIHFEIADNLELWENIKVEPEKHLHKIDRMDLIILRMVLMEHPMTLGLKGSTRNLIQKIDVTLKGLDTTDFNLN